MSKKNEYIAKIKQSLDTVLDFAYVPELGSHKTGKVREIHDNGSQIIMVASDRVSAFDVVIKQRIPFKGAILNKYNEWAMDLTSSIMPNAMIESPDPNVIIQKRTQNLGFEFIVRGYMWGSMAAGYEGGERSICGIDLPDDLLRYQKLDEPLFTPTTKAHVGHDENVTIEAIVKVHGQEVANEVKEKALALYKKGYEEALKNGLILLDTKFEFGFDENGKLTLIDECLTPDSSRYVTLKEYISKWPDIQNAMNSGNHKNVSELVDGQPTLKIKEASKQYVRDVLISSGYRVSSGKQPTLTEAEVIETAWRYIQTYEQLTGRTFDFVESELTPRKRIRQNLMDSEIIWGGCIIPIGSSDKLLPHWYQIAESLGKTDVPHRPTETMSPYIQADQIAELVERTNGETIEPVVFLTYDQGDQQLAKIAARNTTFPVIDCSKKAKSSESGNLIVIPNTGEAVTRAVNYLIEHR